MFNVWYLYKTAIPTEDSIQHCTVEPLSSSFKL